MNLSGSDVVGLALIFAGAVAIMFIAYVVHASAENQFVQIRFIPRIRVLPWTSQNRLRRMKVQAEYENAHAKMLEQKRLRIQQELILIDLDETRHQKVLGPGRGTEN